MANTTHAADTVASRRTHCFELLRTWAKQNAHACMTIETSDDEALDIRLGESRQLYLVAPRQKSAMYFLAFGVLPRTPHRHGCPGQFLDWIQTSEASAFPKAMYVSNLNAYSVSFPILFDEWPETEGQFKPILAVVLGCINRLLTCYQEANLLVELDSADADALRTRFQENTLSSLVVDLTGALQ